MTPSGGAGANPFLCLFQLLGAAHIPLLLAPHDSNLCHCCPTASLSLTLLRPIGEGNGTPLQYSCLENPMNGGAWWAAVHGVAKSQTRLQLHFHFSLSCIGEGNGNPLQCSCLENPRDGGAWWAAIYGVAQSWTRLKCLSSSSLPITRPL